jgi:ATP-dependent helicase Lhr and Lhr-like helicase
LLAYRLARDQPNTFSISVNDYGFELLSASAVDASAVLSRAAWREEGLLADVLASLNSGELAQRRFREIARISGLVFQGFPGAPKTTKQVQASSSLFFEVFKKYDAGNLLLTQAEREVLSQELELGRMQAALAKLRSLTVKHVALSYPSPLCLPLLAERLRETLSTEELSQRLQKMLEAGVELS